MIAWGKALVGAMSGFHNEAESGLVRMFRIEYAKDYQQLRKMGTQLDDAFVRHYIRANKSQ